MANLFGSGTNKKVTGKAADSGYNATKTTVPKLQVQLPNLQNLFQSNISGTGRQVTGKVADARTTSTPRVQLPTLQTATQNLGTTATPKQVAGKAADSGYTPAKKQASQAANRQTVQNVFQPITFGATNQGTGKAADSGITTELRRAQQQANRQTVGNLFQGTTNRANKQNDYSLAKGTAGVLQKGLQQIAEAGGNTFAYAEDAVLAPFELAFGRDLGEFSDNAPFNRWAQKIREEGDAVDTYYADNIKAGGKGAELYDYIGSSLIAAVPMAAAAVYSGGTAAVATPASLQAQAAGALSPGLIQTARDVASGVTKDPQYWLSFLQMVGNNYENTIADMEQQNAIAQLRGGKTMDSNSIRAKAALQAMGSGLMNAAIEVGSGLQTLPKELRQGGNIWEALANSGIGEGKEEVFQGIVDRASQNLVYNKGNPLISLTDPNAVFSLPTAANEFTEGFTIGSILGGGQAGVLSAAQAIQGSPITSYTDAFRRFIGGNKATSTENTADSALARYQELERKYLDGSISPQEADELWRLERMKGQGEVLNENAEINSAPTYDFYRELERKFLNGSIDEQEMDKLRKLDNILSQSDGASKHTGKISKAEGNMPSIANFGDVSYNENTWSLFKKYTSSIDSGELSPLANFALYQQINNEMDNLLIGGVTNNGIAITGKSSHSIARVIGSVEQRRNGVAIDDVLHALIDKDSEVLPIKELKNGRSQKFRNDKVEVSVNPDTGIIIQVNPVHSKRKVKE